MQGEFISPVRTSNQIGWRRPKDAGTQKERHADGMSFFLSCVDKKDVGKKLCCPRKITFPEETNSVLSSYPMPAVFSYANDVYKT